jgi:hypothetical protein
MNKSINEIYDSFWKRILEKNGKFNFEQCKRELADYYVLLENAAKVYGHVTNHATYNVMVDPRVIINLNNESHQETYDEGSLEGFQEAIELVKHVIDRAPGDISGSELIELIDAEVEHHLEQEITTH